MMRVLIALADPARGSGFHEGVAVEGELAVPVVLECGDPDCGCVNSWVGVVSGGITPLVEVVERPNLDWADLRRAVHDLLDRLGWIERVAESAEAGRSTVDGFEVTDRAMAVDALVDEHVAVIAEIVESFPVGSVLSRLGQLIAPTSPPARAA